MNTDYSFGILAPTHKPVNPAKVLEALLKLAAKVISKTKEKKKS